MPTESVSYRLRTRDLTYVALCAVLIAVCAWISIPAPVPFTLQTFGIFAALTLLGGRRGCYAVAVYLLLGLVGLPVFAGFQGGAGTLLGVTGGYILGFGAAALIYWLVTARLGASLPVSILAAFWGFWCATPSAQHGFWLPTPGPSALSALPRPSACACSPLCFRISSSWPWRCCSAAG